MSPLGGVLIVPAALLAGGLSAESGPGSGTTTGTIIATVGVVVTTVLTIFGKRYLDKRRVVLPEKPADSAMQVAYKNLERRLSMMEKWAAIEIARYQSIIEQKDRWAAQEIEERDRLIDYKDAVINVLDDEVLDLRGGVTESRYPPLPPRRPRPART